MILKKTSIIFLLTPFLLPYKSIGQEIKGDTIYVTTEFPVQIKFPTDNIIASFSNPNAPYSWTSVGQNLQIRAKAESDKCSSLIVNEGKRNHVLIVCYKKDMDPENLNEVLHDWGSVKKLDQRKKEIDIRTQAFKLEGNAQPKVSKDQKTKPNQNQSQPNKSESNSSYYKLLEDGDRALKNGSFDEAESKYEEVLRVQPDNNFAKKGLADVKEKKIEKENQAKKELSDKINKIRTTATIAFSSKKYDEAISGYEEALTLNPNDLFSKNQIVAIKKIQADNEQKEIQEKDRLAKKDFSDKINSIKASATKAFDQKHYDDALSAYTQVLTLAPDDVVAKNRIETIQKIKTQNKLKEKEEQENKDRDETYKTIVANADKAFDTKDFEVAKAGYIAAKELKPGDVVLDKKIRNAEEKIGSKQKEDEYNTVIKSADEARDAEDYNKAKTEYGRASLLFRDRSYPADQIKEINKKVTNLAAAQTAEKEKQNKEIQKNTAYQSAIEKADIAMSKKDYTYAKSMYTQASGLKPDEVYPRDRLTEILLTFENRNREIKAKADSIASAVELNKKYNTALLKGKTALERNDYSTAKNAYVQAMEIKPNEQEPKDKLEFIDKKFINTDINKKYDSLIIKGNLAQTDRNSVAALEYYKQAQRVKPLDNYVLKQIKNLQIKIDNDSLGKADAQKQEEFAVMEEVNKKRFKEGMKAYSNYEAAAQLANYDDQLFYLKQFVNILPDNSLFSTRQYDNDIVEFAKNKIKAIRDYLTRTKGSKYQIEAIPFLSSELESKYENINFTVPPPEQKYDSNWTKVDKENKTLIKEVLNESPRLNLRDSASNVNFICQSISFKGDYAFFKLLVQNSDKDVFLAGPLQLSHTQSRGKALTNHDAVYVSAFPIVLPGKEFFDVYQTKNFDLGSKDVLHLELQDRLKKTKLNITIPGSVFLEEKKR